MSKRPPNQAHILLEQHVQELGFGLTREYEFAKPQRRWRFDYVIGPVAAVLPDDRKLCCAIEIEGAIHVNGRHTRGKGYQGDLDKYNFAVAKGWRVLRFSTDDVMRGRAKAFLQEHLL